MPEFIKAAKKSFTFLELQCIYRALHKQGQFKLWLDE